MQFMIFFMCCVPDEEERGYDRIRYDVPMISPSCTVQVTLLVRACLDPLLRWSEFSLTGALVLVGICTRTRTRARRLFFPAFVAVVCVMCFECARGSRALEAWPLQLSHRVLSGLSHCLFAVVVCCCGLWMLSGFASKAPNWVHIILPMVGNV